jgi:hypothetical protein
VANPGIWNDRLSFASKPFFPGYQLSGLSSRATTVASVRLKRNSAINLLLAFLSGPRGASFSASVPAGVNDQSESGLEAQWRERVAI